MFFSFYYELVVVVAAAETVTSRMQHVRAHRQNGDSLVALVDGVGHEMDSELARMVGFVDSYENHQVDE